MSIRVNGSYFATGYERSSRSRGLLPHDGVDGLSLAINANHHRAIVLAAQQEHAQKADECQTEEAANGGTCNRSRRRLASRALSDDELVEERIGERCYQSKVSADDKDQKGGRKAYRYQSP